MLGIGEREFEPCSLSHLSLKVAEYIDRARMVEPETVGQASMSR
jgi:hypothetical protein